MDSATGPYCVGELLMIDRTYLARQATALFKLARSSADPDVAAALIAMAADLKARIDETTYPDVTPLAPDIEQHP
jgi:hypothetical protein